MQRVSELIASVMLGIMGLWTSYGAYNLGLGQITNPGAGFFPFWAGIALASVSLYMVVKAFLGRKHFSVSLPIWKDINWIRIGIVVTSLFLYTAVFFVLGFVLTSFLLMAILFMLDREHGPLRSVIYSSITVAAAYLIFEHWLMVHFPKSFLGF